MSARKGYKTADVCKLLELQPYVLRYWETEFPALHPSQGSSGARTYNEADFGLIRRIKQLLYDEGYTIAGAKKKLESDGGSDGPGEGLAPDASLFDLEAPAVEDSGSSDVATGEESASVLDTDSADRIERFRRGVEEALVQARAALAIVGKSSR
ncbi:MAG: MerR family transcriptional regulator [Thermoanaerobaculia bacterium]